MKLLRRNTVQFTYRPYTGRSETLVDGIHTGVPTPTYGAGATYRGNISPSNGYVQEKLFGINLDYTHVLLMDKFDAPIAETGIIEWNGETYTIKAVKRSMNVLNVALKRQTPVTVHVTPVQGENSGD